MASPTSHSECSTSPSAIGDCLDGVVPRQVQHCWGKSSPRLRAFWPWVMPSLCELYQCASTLAWFILFIKVSREAV